MTKTFIVREIDTIIREGYIEAESLEEAEEIVSVDYEGDSLEVGFNVGYLQDVLAVIDDSQVRITLHDANSSAVLEDPAHEDATYVVMPMKL